MKVIIKHTDSDVPKENYEFYNDLILFFSSSVINIFFDIPIFLLL